MGDTEFVLGAAEAKKQVKTSSDWSSAWRRACKAITFLFPHRASELAEYAEYIEGLFDAKNVSAHGKIILYDIAIRNEVGGGQNILLTDTSQFLRLHSAIVMPDGVEYGSAGAGVVGTSKKVGSNGKSKSGDTCNKFNTPG